jgi:putative ABC transport system permease protein
LRAVGAARGQVLRSVAAEAALMGVVGGVLGLGVGLFLEWYVVDVMVWDEAGFTFPLVVPWAAAGLVFAASCALASLVGLWPAYHATRLRIPEAIAYE